MYMYIEYNVTCVNRMSIYSVNSNSKFMNTEILRFKASNYNKV